MKLNTENLDLYLKPTVFIDSDSPEIINFVHSNVSGISDVTDKMIRLYYLVRDDIKYDFYNIGIEQHNFKASNVLKEQRGFCIPKAILLAAVARAIGVPSRLGFGDVQNHLATEKVLNIMKTDIFVFHGYVELFLHNKWVKATPAFNLSLCEKFGVKPLDFDGKNDSVFQPFDNKGEQYMEYIYEHGTFADLPYELMKKAFYKAYPHLFGANGLVWPKH
jgi:transglutaminase-like putative cysteine protease